uniref:Retrotransposon protein, putative, Ty1-copia subclass n=1 Tax=Tanacetum cinerariifolium TaxID=118510 RepID=A0A6L2KNF8_TANCI|nr:retrotransposon protein, putative, Ty1-copia subclass [Tanacetum cinerariifolium]
MTGARFDIEKFNRTGDFRLWRVNMRALLIQHGCEAALAVLPVDIEAQAKAELNKKAHSAMILCLGNMVLREVTGETTTTGVWSKLETLSLANKLYLKKKLYTFYMPAGRKIFEHIKMSSTKSIIQTLCGYLTLWTGIFDFGGRDATLNSKEIKERSKAKGDDGEGLYVRGRTDRKDSRQSRGKSRSKSRGGRLKCYIFQSEDHLKRNCPKNTRKKSSGYVNKDDQPSSSGLIYDGSEVMMVMSVEALLDWIMNSGGSYHMTPRLDLFSDFLECDEGRVLLVDNRECKIRGIVKVRVQLKDGSSFVLHNVRVVLSGTQRDNYVYSLDGHAVAGELNASVEEKDSLAQVWHKRLRHISEAGLQVLEKQGLFGKKSLDLWGPSQVELLGGKRYFLSIVDDYSRRKFKQLYIESGIARHLAVVGTPQQNGLAERMNRTLMDKVRCLLIQSRLLKTFWAEATWYPEGVKGYRLYRLDNESPKIVTSRNVVLNKSVIYKDTLKDSGAGVDKSVKELQVEVELQRLNNHTLEKDQTDQDDGDDEDAGDQEIDQPPDLTDYQLVRDRESRTRTKPLRFRDESNMAAYAFAAAEEEEMDSLRKNKTCELVDHQVGQKLMTYEWVFKIKEGIKGVQKPRYKARLVARGFTQREGIDYNELDVKTAFLHGNLEEVIYMRQPLGYEQGNKVCLLKKSLYGLKQSPRQWYRRFDEYMLSNGFKRSSYDICVYYGSYAPSEYIYLLLYVDDMLIACKSKAEIGSTKSLLKREFDIKDLGKAKKILAMEIVRDRSRKILRVSQSGYISKILNNFRIDNEKSVQMPLSGHFKLSLKDCPIKDCDVEKMSKVPYANAVRTLMYLMVCTRPGIAYAECVASWKATLQHVVALSTTEAEYMALTEAVKEAIWLRGLLEELGVEFNRVTVKEVLKAKTVEVLKMGTEHNVAVALTNVGHRAEEETSRKGLDLDMPAACPEVLNQGTAILSLQGKRDPERKTMFKRLEKGVFHRLGDKGKSMCAYSNDSRCRSYHSSRRDTKRCYRSSRSRETKFASEKRHNKRASSRRTKALSKSESSARGHWKSQPKRQKSSVEDDRSQPWLKKCIKDPVEIHNSKQRDGESTEEFVRRYKLECRDVKGAPECMKIFRFIHEITNPKLIKRLHDKISMSMEEMMRVTTTFLRGEVAAYNREWKKSFPS